MLGYRNHTSEIQVFQPQNMKINFWKKRKRFQMHASIFRDRFVYATSQWEMTLQCNVISHWMGTHTKWSLHFLYSHANWSTHQSPVDIFISQWTGSSLVKVMACHLCGAKPLSEPIMTYCQLDPWKLTLVKFQTKYRSFLPRKCI